MTDSYLIMLLAYLMILLLTFLAIIFDWRKNLTRSDVNVALGGAILWPITLSMVLYFYFKDLLKR